MPMRNMGALKLPAVGLGAMGLSAFYDSSRNMSHEEKLKFLDDAILSGVRFIDTAQL